MTDQTGMGIKIGISDDGSSYTLIAGIHDTVDGPEMSGKAIDVTDSDSPDGWREYIGSGIKDGGKVGFKINWDPADAQWDTLVAALDEVKHWQITYPDGSSAVTFQGVLEKLKPSAPLEDKMTAEIEIQVSGKPVWT